METTINERVRTFLFEEKIQQVDFAQRLNVTKQQVSNWFSMDLKIPDKYLIQIIKLYPAIDARWMITGKRAAATNNQVGNYNASVNVDGSKNEILNDSFNQYNDPIIKLLKEENESLKKDKEFLQNLLNNMSK